MPLTYLIAIIAVAKVTKSVEIEEIIVATLPATRTRYVNVQHVAVSHHGYKLILNEAST